MVLAMALECTDMIQRRSGRAGRRRAAVILRSDSSQERTNRHQHTRMPGPCNTKRKRKAQKKKSRATQHDEHDAPCTELDGHDAPHTEHDRNDAPCAEYNGDDALLAAPNVYDPGTGPRVRNAKAFLASYFAQPPSLNDALCAEFAQEEILEMLCTVLCEDLAMVRAVASRGHD